MVYRWSIISELIVHHGYKDICEIGISVGDNVRNIRRCLKDRKYHLDNFIGIDPHIDERYKLVPENIKFSEFKYLNMDSNEALGFFKDDSLDLIFIDGSHDPKQIEKDIVNYTKKMKDGSCIIGDDYNDFTGKGIKEVVQRLIGVKNLHTVKDKRLESGRENWLWWTYVKRGENNGQEYTHKI